MKKAVAIADSRALLMLRLVAAANLLFLLAFVLMLTIATGRARAETVACAGKDMISELKKNDPSALAKIEAEAAKTENGKGLLWKIEKAGAPQSYLFGTMHVTDPRVTTLPPAAQAAYDGAGTVVIETTEVLDQAKMMASMMAKPDLTMFTDGTTLSSLIPPDEVGAVNKGLEARGIPPYSVAKMKPWIISAMLALPACELKRKAEGAPVLDVKLGQDALAKGKTLEGLETMEDQLGAMASLPMDLHIRGLIDTLRLGDRLDDVTETMVVLYLNADTGMFWPLFRAVLPSGDGDDAGYAAFEQTMITARNKTMLAHAEPILDKGGAFIAVGAMHLPGPEGLVTLMRKAGYTVSRADAD